MTTEATFPGNEAHRHFAQACNQRVWTLVAQSARTPDEDAKMLDAAHAMLAQRDDARNYLALAEAAGQAIADDEDREIFTSDLTGGDWYGLR